MADPAPAFNSALFSPSSKMFIGGLSWQTSPGKDRRPPPPRRGPPLFLPPAPAFSPRVPPRVGRVPPRRGLPAPPVRPPPHPPSPPLPLCFSLSPQTALETILANSEKLESVWSCGTPPRSAPGKTSAHPGRVDKLRELPSGRVGHPSSGTPPVSSPSRRAGARGALRAAAPRSQRRIPPAGRRKQSGRWRRRGAGAAGSGLSALPPAEPEPLGKGRGKAAAVHFYDFSPSR